MIIDSITVIPYFINIKNDLEITYNNNIIKKKILFFFLFGYNLQGKKRITT